MKDLYIKKGNRYEPLIEPEIDDTLYIKRGKKYIPYYLKCRESTLSEGVWVVTSRPGVRSITNGSYLNDIFTLNKCCDIEPLTLKETGSLHKLCEEILERLSNIEYDKTRFDLVHHIIGTAYNILKEK